MKPSLKYRPEIDGLRAIAVLGVIFYHIELPNKSFTPFSGGFLGVDVFFVLSGYLITKIIFKEILKNTFSYSSFYERRVRRILPPFLFVALSTVPFAYKIMTPEALKEYAGSVLASIGFMSNFWFWLEDSYTAEASHFKPFLHMWTLSLEEQFYIILPPTLIFIFKYFKKYIYDLLLVIFFSSLLTAHFLSDKYIDLNFYLLPSRGWELAAGSLVAWLELYRFLPKNTFLNKTLPILGTISILFSFAFFNDNMQHPSFNTLLPVLGTAAVIIWCQKQSIIYYFLTNRFFIFSGLLSYSLYLWHQPIFAFYRLAFGKLTYTSASVLICLTYLLAFFSYTFIEQPFRKRSFLSTKYVYSSLAIGFSILVAFCSYFYFSDGLPQRLGSVEDIFSQSKAKALKKDGIDCHTRPLDSICEFHTTKNNNSTVLINVGDSHANVLGESLLEHAKNRGLNYVHMSRSGCGLLWQSSRTIFGDPKPCSLEVQKARMEIIKKYKNKIVVYTLSPHNLSVWKTQLVPPRSLNHLSAQEYSILMTLNELAAISSALIIVYPVPVYKENIRKMVKQRLDSVPNLNKLNEFKRLQIKTDLNSFSNRSRKPLLKVYSLINEDNVFKVYPSNIFCNSDKTTCSALTDNAILVRDRSHLSPIGAKMLAEEINKTIINVVQKRKNLTYDLVN